MSDLPMPPPAPPASMPNSVQRATLIVLEPKVQGKSVSVGPVYLEIPFAINPKEIQRTSSAEWKSKPSKKPQPAEYTGLKPETLQFEVMFDDDISGGDTAMHLGVLLLLVKPLAATAASNPRPPFVQISWGTEVSDIYIAKQVQVKITRFNPDGKPIRGTATIQLEQAMVDMPKQNPTSGGPAGRRVHTTTAGDTLASIATAEYGDPRQWRTIASVNGIDDPMRLLPGTRLMLPRPDDLPVNP